jgi:hypothetical protein
MNKVKIVVSLEKDIILKLKNIEKFTSKSTSSIISEIVTEYAVKKIPKKKIGIIGIGSSSEFSDIANKKEEYLKGFGED